MIVIPSGFLNSAPSPPPNASDKLAKSAASVVIRIGRNRAAGRPQKSRLPVSSFLALRFERKVDHHDAVLFHDADQQDDSNQRNDVQLLFEDKES
jgi:hypothetical protein